MYNKIVEIELYLPETFQSKKCYKSIKSIIKKNWK